jgi:hypothetical protein
MGATTARNSMAFRSELNANIGELLRSPDTEDKKLRKDPLEVLALKVPFGLELLSE